MNEQNQAPARVLVAKIATAHGVRGLIKLTTYVENLDLLLNPLYPSETSMDVITLKLKNATAKHWLAEIPDITDRNAAEALRGTELYMDKSLLPELTGGEMYVSDMVGLPAIDENGTEIGKVISIENYGAGDLIEIQPQGEASFLLPYTDETVLNKSKDQITVSIPEGLRD